MKWGFIGMTHFNHTPHENVHNIQEIPDKTLLLSYCENLNPIGLLLLMSFLDDVNLKPKTVSRNQCSSWIGLVCRCS
jgi:hypothetical protein